MTLSVCLIVRDEEKNLARCLDECQHYADEIVIVDTGSMDNTLAVAAQYGAITKKVEWQDDFAQARNIGLDLAQNKWILVLDADEVLAKEDGLQLVQFLKTEDLKDIEGFLVTVLNFSELDEKGTAEKNKSLRLFLNKPSIRYEGKIHEQIKGIKFIAELPVSIDHFGYLDSEIIRKNKHQRNQRLLLNALTESPDTKYYIYHLGINAYSAGDDVAAETHLKRLIEMLDGNETYAPRAYKCLVLCYKRQDKIQEMLGAITICLERWPDFTDIYFIRASVYKEQGAYCEALADLQKCLDIGEVVGYDSHQGVGTIRPLILMQLIYVGLGQVDIAIKCLEQLLDYQPDNCMMLAKLCDLHYQQQRVDLAKTLLNKYVNRHISFVEELIEQLWQCRNYNLLIHFTTILQNNIAISFRSSLLLAYSLLYTGQWSQALATVTAMQQAAYSMLGSDEILRIKFYCLWLLRKRDKFGAIKNELITTSESKQETEVFGAFVEAIISSNSNISQLLNRFGVETVKQLLIIIVKEVEPLDDAYLFTTLSKMFQKTNISCRELLMAFENRIIPKEFMVSCKFDENLSLTLRYHLLNSYFEYRDNNNIDNIIKETKELIGSGARAVGLYEILASCYQMKATFTRRCLGE